MQTFRPIRIIIAEDHQLFADGLEKLLNDEPQQYNVVAKVYNGKQLIEWVDHTFADLLLLDVNMPVINGLEAAIRIRKQHPHIKIIFVSMDTSPKVVSEVRQQGFDGIVPKDIPIYLLKKIIMQVMQNEKVYLGSKAETSHAVSYSVDTPKLSPRQIEIITLIRQGVTTNKEIAVRLSLSVFTVETHVKNIFQLLNVKNKVELINTFNPF